MVKCVCGETVERLYFTGTIVGGKLEFLCAKCLGERLILNTFSATTKEY